MDVLSDVIGVLRTGTPVVARARWYGRFGQRFAAVPGAAGFRVVTEGSCWLYTSTGPPVFLDTGDIVLFPHGREHALADEPSTPLAPPRCDRTEGRPAPATWTGPSDVESRPATVMVCGAYELGSGARHPLLSGLPEVVHLRAGAHDLDEIRGALALLTHELDAVGPGGDAVVAALLDMLLLYILRAWLARSGEQVMTGWAAALRDPAISAVLADLHANPSYPWTVEGLGRRAGLSRAAFARRFHQLVGQPPLTYLTWWRMSLAARMLRESTVSNSAVARRLGYASELSFGRAFKRHHGVSPGSFRQVR